MFTLPHKFRTTRLILTTNPIICADWRLLTEAFLFFQLKVADKLVGTSMSKGQKNGVDDQF